MVLIENMVNRNALIYNIGNVGKITLLSHKSDKFRFLLNDYLIAFLYLTDNKPYRMKYFYQFVFKDHIKMYIKNNGFTQTLNVINTILTLYLTNQTKFKYSPELNLRIYKFVLSKNSAKYKTNYCL